MTNWEKCSAVERDPDKLSGAWVFRGTRVPVSALFENLKDGATVEAVLAHEVKSLADAVDNVIS